IGQGFVGRSYADNFEARGYTTVRYALEAPYVGNKSRIKECDLVFIAVPTPSTPDGFDVGIVREALALVGSGKIAVIKSTILPGTTEMLQREFPDRVVLVSPEFLSEATAAHDAAHPYSNIIGLPTESEMHREAANQLLTMLPKAPFVLICRSVEAEVVKYSHNVNGYVLVVLFNLLYDFAERNGADWSNVQAALAADPYISSYYTRPVHKSGRGAGGYCFIKDFAAFRELYGRTLPDDKDGMAIMTALERKNIALLLASGKSLDLLEGVYGKDALANS
ncbi:MAG TPA: hypothetical protein VF696_01525, partial [Candidatus Paceibacterota bacterium]